MLTSQDHSLILILWDADQWLLRNSPLVHVLVDVPVSSVSTLGVPVSADCSNPEVEMTPCSVYVFVLTGLLILGSLISVPCFRKVLALSLIVSLTYLYCPWFSRVGYFQTWFLDSIICPHTQQTKKNLFFCFLMLPVHRCSLITITRHLKGCLVPTPFSKPHEYVILLLFTFASQFCHLFYKPLFLWLPWNFSISHKKPRLATTSALLIRS